MKITREGEKPDPLESLASGQLPGAEPEPQPGAPAPGEAKPDPVMEAMVEGITKVLFGLCRAVRSRVAKSLPEIMEEWPDDMLREPAASAVPLIQKHASKVGELMGAYPEEGRFVVSLIPLAMGYMAASEKHEKARTTTTPVAVDVVQAVQRMADGPKSDETQTVSVATVVQ